MSLMVEKVARAIVRADEQNGGPCWDQLMTMGKHVMGPVYDRAQAAIAAMRDPTHEMIEITSSVVSSYTAKVLWQKMIDEACK